MRVSINCYTPRSPSSLVSGHLPKPVDFDEMQIIGWDIS